MGERRNAKKSEFALVVWRDSGTTATGPLYEVACADLADLRGELVRHRVLKAAGKLDAEVYLCAYEPGHNRIIYDDDPANPINRLEGYTP